MSEADEILRVVARKLAKDARDISTYERALRDMGLGELLEAQEAVIKKLPSLLWRRLGETGDESDWYECFWCEARTRGTARHKPDCPFEKLRAALAKLRQP